MCHQHAPLRPTPSWDLIATKRDVPQKEDDGAHGRVSKTRVFYKEQPYLTEWKENTWRKVHTTTAPTQVERKRKKFQKAQSRMRRGDNYKTIWCAEKVFLNLSFWFMRRQKPQDLWTNHMNFRNSQRLPEHLGCILCADFSPAYKGRVNSSKGVWIRNQQLIGRHTLHSDITAQTINYFGLSDLCLTLNLQVWWRQEVVKATERPVYHGLEKP